MNALQREALAALARGWSLTTCEGKRPTRPHWQAERELPRDLLLAHAALGKNIGIRTGQISGIVVLDTDVGSEFFCNIETPICITPSGGRHLFFKAPQHRVTNSVSKLARKVDVRGDGGMVILAGSMCPKTRGLYSWGIGLSPADVSIAELPDDIARALAPRPPAISPQRSLPQNVSLGYVREACRREFEAVSNAANGTRNDLLNRAAFSLARFAQIVPLDEIEALLLAGAANCGLVRDDGEAACRSTIRSGFSAVDRRSA